MLVLAITEAVPGRALTQVDGSQVSGCMSECTFWFWCVCVCVCVLCVCVCASLLDGIVERKSTCMYVCVCVCAHTAVLL